LSVLGGEQAAAGTRVILAIWKFGIYSKAAVLASSVVSGERHIQRVITTFLKYAIKVFGMNQPLEDFL